MQGQISTRETAGILGVSMATVHNWKKLGYLKPITKDKKTFFSYNQIVNTRQKIINGKFEKLNSRANKKNSTRTFFPSEYINDHNSLNLLKNVFPDFGSHGIMETMYFLSLNVLASNGLIRSFQMDDYRLLSGIRAYNPYLADELRDWASGIDFSGDKDYYRQLFQLDLPEGFDILGTIYQSLLSEGHKSCEGTYYTPAAITNEMVRCQLSHLGTNARILDPCCGTGQFLVAAADFIRENSKNPDPSLLYGYDVDPVAIRIARLNLYLKFPMTVFKPNIYRENIIDLFPLENMGGVERDFDLVIGNPPWGADFKLEYSDFLRSAFPEIISKESFSFFIYIGLQLLKNGGILSFLLPESVINIRTHRDIRSYILKNSGILKICELGRIFKKVFTPVIRLDLQKGSKPDFNTEIRLERTGYSINSGRFSLNHDKIFDIYISPADEKIIHKVYSFPHTSLYRQSEWILGIVTGNNGNYLSTKSGRNYEPILKGKDIEKFTCKTPSEYLLYRKDKLQQAAPVEKYKVPEKLVYRFISKKLVFAYDCNRTLTLNSANCLIPKVPDYPVKVILALLNSTLYQYLFNKKFFTHKVLRSHLENLPLPLWEKPVFDEIVTLTDYLIHENYSAPEKEKLLEMIDKIIFREYKLKPAEIMVIKSLI